MQWEFLSRIPVNSSRAISRYCGKTWKICHHWWQSYFRFQRLDSILEILRSAPFLCGLSSNESFLQRSISNLVRNAIRYAGQAGPIAIRASREGNTVAIGVSDCGPGLPEAELEKIFAPFYRPEEARTRETGGMGLGLAIVKSCVEACRGTIECHNREPHGLEVIVRLPAAQK